MFPLPVMVLGMFLTSKTNKHTLKIDVPVLLSSLSSLVVDFVDGGVLSINKHN